MLRALYIIAAIAVLCGLSACQKNEITIATQQVASHTTIDLNGIYFINDSSGYICGGTKSSEGILLSTTTGGTSWSAADSILNAACYTMQFFSTQDGYVGSYGGDLSYTSNSGQSFSTVQIDPSLATQCISFRGRMQGIAACGGGYKSGNIYYTSNGGAHWSIAYHDSLHALMCVAYADDSIALAGGYGTVIRSQDGGRTWRVVVENGDFYQAMDFVSPTTGYVVGYQGGVLKTTDGGNTWYDVRSTNGLFSSADHLLGVDFIDANTGFAVGESGLMLRTTDGGNNWQTVRAFTDQRLRAVHLFSATSGIVVGAGGRIYLFKD